MDKTDQKLRLPDRSRGCCNKNLVKNNLPQVMGPKQLLTGDSTNVNGSLSSGASSSGCSSVECSSLEVTPSTQVQTINSASEQVVADDENNKDFLEVNELLYLKRSQTIAHKKNKNSISKFGGDGLPVPEPTMSEFSAFTLRKSLKLKQQASDRNPTVTTTRRLSSAALRPKGLISDSSKNHLSTAECCCCYCCCCKSHNETGEGKTPTKKVSSLNTDDELDCSKNWRRATIIGRPPTRPLIENNQKTTSSNNGGGKLTATVAPFVGLTQRQKARRSLPVPPPVVPLYKDETLTKPFKGGASVVRGERRVEKLTELNHSFCADHCDNNPEEKEEKILQSRGEGKFLLEPRGSHITPTKSVNILCDTSSNRCRIATESILLLPLLKKDENNNKLDCNCSSLANKGQREQTKELAESKVVCEQRVIGCNCNCTQQSNGGKTISTSKRSHNNNKLSDKEEDTMTNSQILSPNLGKFQTASARSEAEMTSGKDIHSHQSANQLNCSIVGGEQVDDTASSRDVAQVCEDRGRFSMKRTGKFLELFKLGFLANFATNSGTNSNGNRNDDDDNNKSSSSAARCSSTVECDEQLVSSTLFAAAAATTDAQETQLPAAIDPDRIYDTPEFNGQLTNRANCLERPLKPAVRPSIPPPPPPPLPPPCSTSHPVERARSNSMRAPFSANGDCALSRQEESEALIVGENRHNINEQASLRLSEEDHCRLLVSSRLYSNLEVSVGTKSRNGFNEGLGGKIGKDLTLIIDRQHHSCSKEEQLINLEQQSLEPNNNTSVKQQQAAVKANENTKVPKQPKQQQQTDLEKVAESAEQHNNLLVKSGGRKVVKWASDEVNNRLASDLSVKFKNEQNNCNKTETATRDTNSLPIDNSENNKTFKRSSVTKIGELNETGSGSKLKQEFNRKFHTISRSLNPFGGGKEASSTSKKQNKNFNFNNYQVVEGSTNCNCSGRTNLEDKSSTFLDNSNTSNSSSSRGDNQFKKANQNNNLLKNQQTINSLNKSKSILIAKSINNLINMGASHSTVVVEAPSVQSPATEPENTSEISTKPSSGISSLTTTTTKVSHTKQRHSKIGSHSLAGSTTNTTKTSTRETVSRVTDNDRYNSNNNNNNNFRQQKQALKSSKEPTSKERKQSKDLMMMPPNDSIFELRRKSIQDGDVFIYPTLYKDLNECQKCSRDNKICSCNINTDPVETNNNNNNRKRHHQTSTTVKKPSQALNNKCLPPTINKVGEYSNNIEQSPSSSSSSKAIENHQAGRFKISDSNESKTRRGLDKTKQQQLINDSEEQQIKTVYKISISTASIDQKNNQVILTTPKVIGSTNSTQQQQREKPTTTVAANCQPANHNLPEDTRDNQENKNNNNGNANLLKEKNSNLAASGATDSEKKETSSNSELIEGEDSRVNDEQDTSKLLLVASTNQDNLKQLNNHDSQNHSEANVETKVTAISIGSPTRSIEAQLNYCELLSPLLSNSSSSSSIINKTEHSQNFASKMVDANNNNNNNSSSSSIIAQHDTLTNNPSYEYDESIQSRTSSLINQLIEQERNNEEQLTCNLSVGDSIKITSTSIRIDYGSNKLTHGHNISTSTGESHTSIVPIQTLSCRRRHLASKLSRQAIYEDSSTDLEKKDRDQDSQQLITLNSKQAGEEGEREGQTNQDSPSDTLEYSPILTSVRDYIKNVNTELQVSSPSLLTSGTCEFPINGPISRINNPSESNETSAMLMNGSPVISMAGVVGINTTPTTIVTSTTGALTISSSSVITPGVVTGGTNNLLIHEQTDSPKKSIFDGASKDEILEYLEDARERVPEILMAADDVMVINDNELLVVNQLDPGSPATPISIVEATEVIGTTELIPRVGESSQLLTVSPMPEQPPIERHTPDQLRHRLQQMYHSSQLTETSQFSSNDNNTMDDDTGISSSELQSGLDSKMESSRNSMDTPITPTEFKLTNMTTSGATDLKSFSSFTGTTLESSIENQINGSNLISELSSNLTTNCALFTMNQNQLNLKEQAFQDPINIESQVVKPVERVDSNPQQQQQNNNPTADISRRNNQGLVGGGVPLRTLNYGVSTQRRNSTSSEGSNRAMSSIGYRTIQMLRLQQRSTNRDSLSSPSTSPPSSASPSSSTSSNQTSGNCSAASTFYASSSLSCSSPLLALSSSANTTSITMANNGRFGHLTSQTQAIVRCADQVYDIQQALDPLATGQSSMNSSVSPDVTVDLNMLSLEERDDSGLGSDSSDRHKATNTSFRLGNKDNLEPLTSSSSLEPEAIKSSKTSHNNLLEQPKLLTVSRSLGDTQNQENSAILVENNKGLNTAFGSGQVLIPTNEDVNKMAAPSTLSSTQISSNQRGQPSYSSSVVRFNSAATTMSATCSTSPTFSSSANLMSRSVHGHYATMNRLNNYFMNRHPLSENSDTTIEFQCLDCDQFIDVDHATMLHKTNELRLLRETDCLEVKKNQSSGGKEKLMTADQLDRAYIAAMNGLPLCSLCEKKRVERKEIISEFVETELKYGRDLKIIHDEFYRPMQIAGLLSKDQITGVFLNLEELIMAHCKFAIRLEAAIRDAHLMGDTDFNTINIGRLFVESAEMLHTFESYCIRQGSAACLLARLAKEKELLRIFLRVSQMENTLLRRMNLAAFLMVPVQRVTKYPLLLNRLYKVTAYHHKDREVLRDAQLKVELHLEHINQQTKGVGATNKIWRRISNLSAPISNRRGLINAEDIGYIKLRKTAMDMLKWDRDETQFIHSGKLNFTPLNEFLIKQKMKPMRYMAAHALLIVLGKPNWKYRPDLVKSNLDSKLMTPTPGGNGVKEAALLLFREKGGRFVPCREPLFLSNCVLSADCSQYNSECPIVPTNHHNQKVSTSNTTAVQSNTGSQTGNSSINNTANNRTGLASIGGVHESRDLKDRSVNTESSDTSKAHSKEKPEVSDSRASLSYGDTLSMASVKSLPENHVAIMLPPTHTSRSYSLASALPRTTVSATSSSSSLTKSSSITSSNLTIINQLMTKVNSYGHKQQSSSVNGVHKTIASEQSGTQIMTTASANQLEGNLSSSSLIQLHSGVDPLSSTTTNTTTTMSTSNNNRSLTNQNISQNRGNNNVQNEIIQPQQYNHLFFNNHHHHQPYGDYEESFEIHERLSKESMLLRADTPLKTRYWLQMLRYHAKDLGQWRARRNGLANIMMMRQE